MFPPLYYLISTDYYPFEVAVPKNLAIEVTCRERYGIIDNYWYFFKKLLKLWFYLRVKGKIEKGGKMATNKKDNIDDFERKIHKRMVMIKYFVIAIFIILFIAVSCRYYL